MTNRPDIIVGKTVMPDIKELDNKQTIKVELIYDPFLKVYKIPPMLNRSELVVINAYCEILKHD